MQEQPLQPRQILQEHLEDALVEADASGWTAVAALISEALDALEAVSDPSRPSNGDR